MKNICVTLLLTALVLTVPVIGAEPKAASATAEELLKRYQTALLAKDKAAILALYDWQGVSTEMHAMQEQVISIMLLRDPQGVKLGPVPVGFKAEMERDGVRYHPNVAIVGVLEVQFPAVPKLAGGGTLTVPYGKKDNAFYLSNILEERFANPATAEKTFTVNVNLTATAAPAAFVCTCVLLKGGREVQEEFAKEFPADDRVEAGGTKTNLRGKSFTADRIKSCTARKTTPNGKINLMVFEGQTKIFDSGWEADKPVTYEPPQP